MQSRTINGPILVVSCDPQFVELTKRAFNDEIPALYAQNEQEAFTMLEEKGLSAIILGYIELQEASFLLQQKIRETLSASGIPLIIANNNLNLDENEGITITVDSDNYIRLSGNNPDGLARLLEPESLGNILKSAIGQHPLRFRDAVLRKDQFCVTWEQIAGKGATEEQQEVLINNAIKVMRGSQIHSVSVTDNPGGNPALSTEMICSEIKKLGTEPLVHLASRDKNRNQMESMLYGLSVSGLHNLLILSGDAPSNEGFAGKSKPVFDLDPVQTLELIELMNQGLEYGTGKNKKRLHPSNFFAGVSVSPFKQNEAELMGQYYKLDKKIRAGAKFIINQVGFDARKWHEVLQWLKMKKYDVPVLANIYVMSSGTAKLMNKNRIPGCVVTDQMLADLIESEKSEDKGKARRLLQAAKMYAIARGMGYAGVHIGGHNMDYDTVLYIINEGEKLKDTWMDFVPEFNYPQEDGFYYFEKDPVTGLNQDIPASRPSKFAFLPTYRLVRVIHTILFNPGSWQFGLLQPFAKFLDSGHRRKRTFGYLEHLVKTALFDCMNCGDCALPDVAYICPMSQCPKNQRNGPCGGSYEGWCEVYPDRKCIWVRAYERHKAFGEEDEMSQSLIPPCNWDLWETPSWLNLYLGRDHTAIAQGITYPKKKDKKAA